jgi:hypothetical protein
LGALFTVAMISGSSRHSGPSPKSIFAVGSGRRIYV